MKYKITASWYMNGNVKIVNGEDAIKDALDNQDCFDLSNADFLSAEVIQPSKK